MADQIPSGTGQRENSNQIPDVSATQKNLCHQATTIKWSKQSEQSTFLLLWEVWRTHFGVLPFCFVVEYFE